MRLERVEISGYRSFRGRAVLHVEEEVTVVLGANDHGKTNLLSALTHLNPNTGFDAERDVHWDLADQQESFPRIDYHVVLTDEEREQIVAADQDRLAAQDVEPSTADSSSHEEGGDDEPEHSTESDSLDPDDLVLVAVEELPNRLTLVRRGVSGELSCGVPLSTWAWRAFTELLPSVEVIPAWDQVEDTATAGQIHDNDFMRGIFYYAGLDPADEALFSQTEETVMQLDRASERLNRTLQESWTQGAGLEFLLRHRARSIELMMRDPSVESQYVRPSRRSAGFTHYFALKTILYARERDRGAKRFILLFDEPGLYLHPAGQQDLLREIDALASANQILYVTHSIFMINRTYPARHRLIRKDATGTLIEGKPYTSRWGSVLDALGLSLTGTILFAREVLLTEGDSDPILMYALFQELIRQGLFEADLNGFSAMSTSDSKNAETLLQVLAESAQPPRIAAIFDGDEGGVRRYRDLEATLSRYNVASRLLEEDAEIEDYLPDAPNLYPEAVAAYTARIRSDRGQPVGDEDSWREEFVESFRGEFGENGPTVGLARWAGRASSEIAGIDTPSKVGIAREYVLLLGDHADGLSGADWSRALELANWVKDHLGLSADEARLEAITES